MIGGRPDLAYGALGFALAVFAFCALSLLPSHPVPADAPPEVFSAQRAFRHVEMIAQRPHPAGSPKQAAALAWIVSELKELGLEPELQSKSVEASPWFSELPWLEREGVARDERERPLVPLTNVLVRLPGENAEGAILIQAHYDSVVEGPGAGDNATGVAALLETLRAVLPGAPYKNDLIFLFDDGEELGLLGAKLFAEEHRWMEDVRCVLNFDARGNAGTPICFEVGPGSAALIGTLATSVERPVGTSVAPAVYARLRNDTSFSPFRDRELPGLNFAFVGGASAYHRAIDTPRNLSKHTLQRQGEYCLAMTLAAADLNLHRLGFGDSVFFNFADGRLVHYPLGWTYVLALIPFVMLLLFLRRIEKTDARIFSGLVAAVLLAVGVFAACWGSWWVIDQAAQLGPLFGLFDGTPRGNLASATLSGLGLAAIGLTAALALLERAKGRADILDSLAAGGAIVCALLLLALVILLPGADHLVAWPLVLALPIAYRQVGRERHGAGLWVAAAVSFWAIASLLAPTWYLLLQVGSIDTTRMVTILATLSALGVLVFLPHLRLLRSRRPFGTAWVAGVLGVAATLAGSLAESTGL